MTKHKSRIRFAIFTSADGYLGTVASTPSATGKGAWYEGNYNGQVPNAGHVLALLPKRLHKAWQRGSNSFWIQNNGATTRNIHGISQNDCAPSTHFDAQTVDIYGVRVNKLCRVTAVPYLAEREH